MSRQAEYARHHIQYLWRNAKRRAELAGVPFEILPADIVIPTHCPLLGVPLKKGSGAGGQNDFSPSIDRLHPDKGYTKENILVISHRANRIKNNATVSELLRIANRLAFFIDCY